MGCATGIVKYLVFLANLIFALAGLALIIVGVLYKFSIKEATAVFPSDFGLAPVLSIIIGAIVFITAFLGCCGAVKESTCMLTTYSIVLLTIFIVQVAIGIYVFLQVKDTHDFEAKIRKSVQKTFDNINIINHPEANDTMHLTQSFLHCCGVDGPDDYISKGLSIPNSCCPNQVCGTLSYNTYQDGCARRLFVFLQNSSQVIGGVAIGIAAIEIIGAIFGLCLASSIRNHYRRHIYA